jgi:hypothetical protein
LKRLDANPIAVCLRGAIVNPRKKKKEDVTQSLQYYEQNIFVHNIIDVE